MKTRLIHFVLVLFMACVMTMGLASCDNEADTKTVPVITHKADTQRKMLPRRLLLQPPLQYQGRISPNGQKVSWLSMQDGGLNLFVAESDDPGSARQVTHGKQGVDVHYWTPNSAYILFTRKARNGSRVLTWSLNVASGEVKQLGPDEPDTSVYLQKVSGNWPNSVLVSIQGPAQEFGDLYRINLNTGAARLVRKNTGYVKWVADEDLQPRLGIRDLPGGGQQWDLLGVNGTARRFLTLTAQQAQGTRPLQLDSSGTILYMLDSREAGMSRLMAVDLYSGETSLLAQTHGYSIRDVLFHPVTGLPVAYSWDDDLTQWKALDEGFAPALELAQEVLGSHFVILASTSDMGKLVTYSDSLDRPGKYSIIDRNKNTITTMFETAPEEMVPPSSKTITVKIPTRAGGMLSGYYTPAQSGAQAGNDDAGTPLLIFIPSFPQERFHFHYDPKVTGFTSRGMGVLKLNVPGTGKAGENRNTEGYQAASRDVIDAASWARAQGLVGPDQGIAVISSAFGADTAIKATQHDPGIACAVALDPVINVPAGLQYWQKTRPALAKIVNRQLAEAGTPVTPDWLQALSVPARPVLDRPVLLMLSGTDMQTTADVVEKWAKAQADNGGKVVLVKMQAPSTDEDMDGLGPALAISDEFLGHCLGSQWEAVGSDLDQVDVQLIRGGDYLPKLQKSLQARMETAPDKPVSDAQ